MKSFEGFTLLQISDSYKPNAKSYTIGKLQLHAPTVRITTYGLPLYVMQEESGLHGLKGLVIDCIAVPSQR
jgi:hypothetical protein